MERISIIVPFYARWRHLEFCLRSLEDHADAFDEVVVSDDGSDPQTVEKVQEILSQCRFPVRYVWQPKDGFRAAAARNNGALHATGDYLIFFDCDFVILPGTVRAHLKRKKQKHFVAGFFKCLPQSETREFFDLGFDSAQAVRYYSQLSETELQNLDFRYRRRTLLMKWGLLSHRKQKLVGHVSMYRKDFESVNGYDEKFVGWGGEDEDLGIRLVMNGIHAVSAMRTARALHLWHPTELGGRHWSEGNNMPYFQRKNVSHVCETGIAQHQARRNPCRVLYDSFSSVS